MPTATLAPVVRWEWRVCHPHRARTRPIRTNSRRGALREALAVLVTLAPGTRVVINEVRFADGVPGRREYVRTPSARYLRAAEGLIELDPVTGAVPSSVPAAMIPPPPPLPWWMSGQGRTIAAGEAA